MGIRKPGLKALVRRAQDGPPDRKAFGPARAVIQCHHGGQRRDIGWVHGHAVLGTVWPYDLPHDVRYADYDVFVRCDECKRGWQLDLRKIRVALREPNNAKRKLNVEDVAVPRVARP